MNVVIVGAGEVGCDIAATLSEEGHNVYVVEQDEEKAKIAEELDVSVIRGNGARPQVLHEAGVTDNGDVDLLLACTDRDEVNMLSCWIAHRAGVEHVISRVRSLEFTDSPTWGKRLGIDLMVSPERSVAREILELLAVSSASRTAELLDGRAALYALRVAENSPLAGMALKDIRVLYKDLVAVFVYVEREGSDENAVPDGDTVLQTGDLCYVVTYKEAAWLLEELFQLRKSRPLRRVFVVGGGKLGFQVTQRIQREYGHVQIRLIDHDAGRCARLAEELGGALVLNGDGADPDLLREEGIDEADGYVCATESDEVNLIYAALAKSMGVKKSIAVVRRKQYEALPEIMPVDAVVNPNKALASVILGMIRYPGHARALSVIEKTGVEMLEVIVPEGNKLLGRPLAELGLPKGVLVALMGHGNRVLVPTGATQLQAGDCLILFATTALMREAAELFSENNVDGERGEA
ncbi:MAG: Trk system potassium transporter TrkA [Fretibacterium sp.]|nr:Trk system potassium transporter TrkA [Fretibacterium sp.]